MGRNKSFNEGEVLGRAVGQFWRHGYAGTSVRDLERVMGMGAASLYHAFGDKRALYRRALQRYLDETTRQRARLLDESCDPRGAILDFLAAVLESSTESRDGCLLVNAATELAAQDPQIGAEVGAGFREVEAALGRAVSRAQQAGTIRTPMAPETLARSIIGTVIALRTLARTGAARAELQALVHAQLCLLSPGERPAGAPSW